LQDRDRLVDAERDPIRVLHVVSESKEFNQSLVDVIPKAKIKAINYSNLDLDSVRDQKFDCVIFDHPTDRNVVNIATQIRLELDIPTIICTSQSFKKRFDGYEKMSVDAILPVDVSDEVLMDRILQSVVENRRHKNRVLELEILKVLNWRGNMDETMRRIIEIIRHYVDVEAVGIRLQDGLDYPYYSFDGFADEHILKENHLCAKNRDGGILVDSEGKPILECMCGNILMGRFDPEKPFFTEGGSFWTNSTSKFIGSTTEKDRLTRTRDVCYLEGYESMALVPIRFEGDILGLIQLNDKGENRYNKEFIVHMEKIAQSIGIVIGGATEHKKLNETMVRYHSIFESIQNPVTIIDVDDFTIISSNEATHYWALHHGAKLTSDTCHSLFGGYRMPCEIYGESCPLLNMMEKEEGATNITVRLDGKGERVYLEESANPIKNEKGTITGAVLIVRDITERKLAEQNLIRFL